ncbi:MAG: Polysacc synt protein [Bacteroidetes bacterium]|nr:Polysacc synt protein [Bacteroidota bacterium]
MKRPLANLLSLLFGDVGSRLIGFAISIYLARVLAPAGFGLLSLGLAVLGYLQLASNPGIQILETRNAAAFVDVDRSRVNAVLSLRLVLALALWIVAAATAFLVVKDVEKRDVIILFSLSVFPFALMTDWFFQGKEAFVVVSVSRLAQYLVYGILVLLLVHAVSDVRLAPVAFGTASLVAAGVLWYVYRKRWGSIRLTWTPVLWKEILVKGVPVGTAMFLAQSVTNLPPLVIGYFSSTEDVGLFSSAMKLVFGFLLIDRLFNALFLPVVTRHFSADSKEINTLVEVTLKVVSAIVIPVGVAGMILGRESVSLLYGEEYVNATPLFIVLMGFFILTVFNSVFVNILVGSGRENGYTRMVMWGSVVLCFATVTCTALFGALGAAWAIVLGECVTLLLMMKEAGKAVRVQVFPILVRPLIAGAGMAGAALLLREENPVAVTAMALLVFAVAEFLLKGITGKEIRFMRERFV